MLRKPSTRSRSFYFPLCPGHGFKKGLRLPPAPLTISGFAASTAETDQSIERPVRQGTLRHRHRQRGDGAGTVCRIMAKPPPDLGPAGASRVEGVRLISMPRLVSHPGPIRNANRRYQVPARRSNRQRQPSVCAALLHRGRSENALAHSYRQIRPRFEIDTRRIRA